MSSGEGGNAHSSHAAPEGTTIPAPASPVTEQTLPGNISEAGPTASDAVQPGTTEIPPARSNVEELTPRGSAFELDDDKTQAQGMNEAAQSQLRSKAPCKAPGYDILEPLGAGTFGEVWLAEQQRTGMRVAIKFVAHGADERWQMLQAEVRQLAQLHSDPGIVRLIDVEFDSTPPYYIMAYAKQGSLAQRIEKGTLPVDEALAIFKRVTEALAYVHARGICHCDLKPGNVLLDARGQALVADFGQAHFSSDITPALGTFFYMAPEQANLDSALPDTRWDVYGLGALMFAMLTGRAPRKDESLPEKLKAVPHLSDRLRLYRESIERAPIPTEHRKRPGVDGALADIIDSCLDVDPAKRPRNAAAILAALARRERRRRQRPAVLFGLVTPIVLLLVMTLFAGVMFWLARKNAKDAQNTMDEREDNRNTFIAKMVAEDLDERLRRYIQLVESRAKQPLTIEAIRSSDPDARTKFIKAWLDGIEQREPEFKWLAERDALPKYVWLADRGGRITIMNPPDKFEKHFQWREWFNGQKKDLPEGERAEPIRKTHISQPFLGQSKWRPLVITISTPIKDPSDENNIIGLLVVAIETKSFERWVEPLNSNTSFAVVLNERGHYLFHKEKELIKPELGKPAFSVQEDFALHPTNLASASSGLIAEPFTDPITEKKYVASYASLSKHANWVVAIQRDHGAERVMDKMNFYTLLIGVGAAIFLAILIPALWVWLLWMLRQGEEAGDG